jgi:hypothetical protein
MRTLGPFTFIAVILLCGGPLLFTGCIHDDRPSIEHQGLFGGGAPEVKAPLKDRCTKATGDNLKRCAHARDEAKAYTQHLAPGDQVCLENGIGSEPTDACLARASTADNDTGRVLLHVRSAKPESKWAEKVDSQIWFDEGALIDIFLQERGY